VQRVLEEIGAQDVPQIFVYNKIDKVEGARPRSENIDGGQIARVWVSAVTGAGIDLLRDALTTALQRDRVHAWLAVPDHAGRLRARLIAAGFVSAERPAERGWEIQIDAPRALIEPLFGLPDGEGEWLREQLSRPGLLAASGAAPYNSAATAL